VKDKATKETLNADEVERVLRGYVADALFENGLYCRTDDRGNAVVQVAPPLICGQAEFDEMEQILRHVLAEAWTKL
jgi:adenosylmethionine-8-amino-7-oxononanoate aminotransferase